MARPRGVIESSPRKQMTGRGSTDGESYLLSDSGCGEATHYLKEPSLCLGCPFPECKLDKIRKPGRKAGVKNG